MSPVNKREYFIEQKVRLELVYIYGGVVYLSPNLILRIHVRLRKD